MITVNIANIYVFSKIQDPEKVCISYDWFFSYL